MPNQELQRRPVSWEGRLPAQWMAVRYWERRQCGVQFGGAGVGAVGEVEGGTGGPEAAQDLSEATRASVNV